jgi:DNA/RNA-binding domain of Phe-tRNA-synthetase-like protein
MPSQIEMCVNADVLNLFPTMFIRVLYVQEISAVNVENISERLLEEARDKAKNIFSEIGDLSNLEPIKSWRAAYSQIGLKPSKYGSSIEALIRRAIRGDNLQVFPLVDVYNALSLKHLAPLGAVDVDLLPGASVEFRLARPDSDSFTPLGGRSEDFPLSSKLAVYAVGDTILCWAFNCRDNRLTALRPETRCAVFFTEGINEMHGTNSDSAMNELGHLMSASGAKVRAGYVSIARPCTLIGAEGGIAASY